MTTTHECPAPGCELLIPFERLACPRHWRMVSRDHQAEVYRLWRRDPGSDAYFEARARALHDMGVQPADIPDLNGGVELPS